VQLVVLPGMDGGAELSRECRAILAADFEVHPVEYPHQRLTIGSLAGYVCEQTATLNTPVLLAESFSGPVAVEAMHRYPERFAMGVLACTFVVAPRSHRFRPFVQAPFLGRPPPRWALRRWMVGADASDESVTSVHDAIARVPAEVMADRVRQVLSVDVRETLATLEVPVISIRAQHDRLVRPTSAPEAHAELRAVSIDAPHLALHARPAESARVIREVIFGTS